MSNRYVIDANILFSAIISAKRIYLDMIKSFDLCAPDFTLKEIEKYEDLILERTKLGRKELNAFLMELFQGITILPAIIMDKESKDKALDLCKDIDEKDTPYIALAIELDIPFVTNDQKLYKGLKEKKYTNIILLEDLIDKMEKPTDE